MKRVKRFINNKRSSRTLKIIRYSVVGLLFAAAIILPGVQSWVSGDSTVGAYDKKNAQAGYTLIAPTKSDNIFLINNLGQTVHEWKTNHYPGLDTKLLPNGQLLRTYDTGLAQDFPMGGRGGGIELINWDGSVAWDWQYSSPEHVLHHDAMMMPNGDILTSAWVKIPEAEALAKGVNPENIDPLSHTVWDNRIIEVSPKTSKIVWQWDAYDHLTQNYNANDPNYGNPADFPRRIDANYFQYVTKPDWLHVNAVDYNAKTDQIIVSAREFNEVWIIDHSTTTAEAATSSGGKYGHGGDLLYRYGNPAAYGHGDESNRTFFLQHDIHWIPDGLPGAGDILLFNNGDPTVGHSYSSALELALPEAADGSYLLQADNEFYPATEVWRYEPRGVNKFFSQFMGSAERLPNGDTLITDAMAGNVFEVKTKPNDSQGRFGGRVDNYVVWDYQNNHFDRGLDAQGRKKTPSLFRSYKYVPDYSGLKQLY